MSEQRAKAEAMKGRTREFAVRVIRMADELPKKMGSRVMAGQLVRCATSVGANYHAACRARSKAEFAAKMGIVLEECDECVYWLRLIIDAGFMAAKRVNGLLKEADELTAIFVASNRTARGEKRGAEGRDADC